jgi:hypothetical protein
MITTKKIEAGRYAVLINGNKTDLIIQKGDTPKYRENQEWCISRKHADGWFQILAGDQSSLIGAVNTLRVIYSALQESSK